MLLTGPLLIIIGAKTGLFAAVIPLVIPAMLLVFTVGLKLAAPRLPWGQATTAGATILVVHFGIEHLALHWLHFPPMIIAGEYVIQAICIYGFGRYWITKGYTPDWANWWPE